MCIPSEDDRPEVIPAVQMRGMPSGIASSWTGEGEALSIAPREAVVSWHSEAVRSMELPAARVHGPLAVSAERGVACAFLGVQRAVVLDLVGLRATPVHSHLVAAVPAPPSLLWAGTHAIGSMRHKLSHTATVCARPRALCRRAGQGMTFSVCTAGG